MHASTQQSRAWLRSGRTPAWQVPPADSIEEVGFNVIPSSPWEVGQEIEVCAVLRNFGTQGEESPAYPVRLNGDRIGEVQAFVPAGVTKSACLTVPVPDVDTLDVEIVGIPGLVSGDVTPPSDGNGGGNGTPPAPDDGDIFIGLNSLEVTVLVAVIALAVAGVVAS